LNNPSTSSISLFDLIYAISKKWLFLVGFMIVGGIIAFLLSQGSNKPVYESSATFSVSIDYRETGALSDVQEDQAMRGVGYVLSSDTLVEELIDQLRSDGLSISKASFRENSFIDRVDFAWTIHFRSQDPQTAVKVIRTWEQLADSTIQQNLSHAQKSAEYQSLLWALESCLDPSPERIIFNDWCGHKTVDEILNEIDSLSDQIRLERKQSGGLLSALLVENNSKARVPETPVRNQSGILIVAGSLIGVIVFIAYETILFAKAYKID